jgi:hypothetical protein
VKDGLAWQYFFEFPASLLDGFILIFLFAKRAKKTGSEKKRHLPCQVLLWIFQPSLVLRQWMVIW